MSATYNANATKTGTDRGAAARDPRLEQRVALCMPFLAGLLAGEPFLLTRALAHRRALVEIHQEFVRLFGQDATVAPADHAAEFQVAFALVMPFFLDVVFMRLFDF